MRTLLQQLTLDHSRLINLLEVLECQLINFHAGQEHDLDLACELVQYIRFYQDQIHHPTEELMFAKFKTLANIDLITVNVVEQQHQELADMAGKFYNALSAIMQDDIIPRREVEQQGQSLLKLLREHVVMEEREIFPAIGVRFDAADWADLDAHKHKLIDPIFDQPDTTRFRNLLRYLAAQA